LQASEGPINPLNPNDGIIVQIANILSFVAAIIAVFIIIIAGITMMTSGGDSGKVKNSRNAIIYTVVGLIVDSSCKNDCCVCFW
jgi:type IV secretory pathway VirB2 component (pilin)